MKSVLATLGAKPLSETAALLENASKQEDITLIDEKLPPFLQELRDLHEDLSHAVTVESNQNLVSGETQLLAEKLTAVRTAADEFNLDLCGEILDELLAFDFGGDINALLAEAKQAVSDFDFDKIIAVLDTCGGFLP
jgi:HPt (histidine-containing phosphotransfer) domain-containing protein